MRLRQAHALLEIAKAIEDAGINFEFHPFDHDKFGALPAADDYMTGFAEFNDPDNPTGNTRTYGADIVPGPGPFDVRVRVVYGYLHFDDEAVELVHSLVQVAAQDEEDPAFVTGFAERVARQVEQAVRSWESIYEDAYRKRVAQAGGAQ